MSPFKRPLGRLGSVICLLLTSTALAQPPVSVYASLPSIAQPVLSPDGSKLLMLRAIGDTQHAFVMDLEKRETHPVIASDPKEFFINRCLWANDERVICSIRSYGNLSSGLGGRYLDRRTTFTRMIAVDADGSNRLKLVPETINRLQGETKWNPVIQDNILSILADDPDHILLALNRDDRVRPSVYRLNVYTNKLTRIRKFHDTILRWHARPDGQLAFATGWSNNRPVAFRIEKNRAIPVDISHFVGISEPNVLGVSKDGRHAWVGSYYAGDRYRLHTVDIASGQVVGTLFEDPRYDLFSSNGFFIHPQTGEPVLIQYWTEQPEQHWFDNALAERHGAVKQALSELHDQLWLVSASRDMQRAVIEASGKGTTPTYYLFDASTSSLSKLATTYAQIPAVTDFRVVTYPAADGYRITAYVAAPSGEGPFPTIVYPHGGPNTRDTPRFDYWTQFFVSRGYAVIKPNFRGSVGYGEAHLAAGFGQWGLRMQDDVMAGLDWMIGQGITDPKRVCVVGGSYGGYVALVASFKSPERIRCAVSFAGVADLAELKAKLATYDLGYLSLARIQSGPEVSANSPIAQVKRIGVPLLIVHGDADRSVMIEQSRSLAAALEKTDKPHRYIEQPDGDHFLSNQRHRIQFFEAMDLFLSEHL